MINNDILRRMRYTFELTDKKMISVFKLGGGDVTQREMTDWLKKEEDEGFLFCEDLDVAIFLNGFIIDRRGAKEEGTPKPEKRLTNNMILRKLKIALNLKDTDVLEILDKATFKISKHELSALFRKPNHKHYRECKDQLLRKFLSGLQLTHR